MKPCFVIIFYLLTNLFCLGQELPELPDFKKGEELTEKDLDSLVAELERLRTEIASLKKNTSSITPLVRRVDSLEVFATSLVDQKLFGVLTSRTDVIENEINNLQLSALPIGTIIAYSGSDPPTGWLLCNGEAVPPGEEFKKLRDEVRTNFGTNLAGQPLLPDLQGRVPLGSGKGEGLSQRTIGESLGKEKHTLTAAEMPKHDHEIRTAGRINHQIGGKPGIGWGDYKDVPSGLAGGLQNTLNGQGEPHNNMQPYLVVNFIIKAK